MNSLFKSSTLNFVLELKCGGKKVSKAEEGDIVKNNLPKNRFGKFKGADKVDISFNPRRKNMMPTISI